MKTTSFKLISAIALISLIGLYSCHTTKKTSAPTKTENTTTSSTNTTAAANSYTASAKNIISENCSGCHKGMTSYKGVKWCVDNGEFKSLVIEKRTMPKGRTLSEADYNILKTWIDAGGKE